MISENKTKNAQWKMTSGICPLLAAVQLTVFLIYPRKTRTMAEENARGRQ